MIKSHEWYVQAEEREADRLIAMLRFIEAHPDCLKNLDRVKLVAVSNHGSAAKDLKASA